MRCPLSRAGPSPHSGTRYGRPRTALPGIYRTPEEEDDHWTGGLAPYGYGMIDLALWIDAREGDDWGTSWACHDGGGSYDQSGIYITVLKRSN